MEEQRTYLELQNATEDVYSAVSPPSINKGVTLNSNVYTIGPITQSIRLKKRNHLRNIMIAGGVIALLLLTTILAVTIALFLQSKQASHTNVDFINFFCDLAELDQSNLEYTNPPGVKQKTDEDEDDDMDTHSIISFLSELLTKQHRVLEFLKAKYCNRCPSRWVQYKENCYFFSETRLDWYTSRHNCLKENADLVVIKRTEEQDFLTYHNYNMSWIGLKKEYNINYWQWIDGTDSLPEFWCPVDPYTTYNYSQSCAALKAEGQSGSCFSRWSGENCQENLGSICEKKQYTSKS